MDGLGVVGTNTVSQSPAVKTFPTSFPPSLLPSFLEEERRDTDLMKKLFWPQLLMKSYDLSSGSSLSTPEL